MEATAELNLFHELSFYTLGHPNKDYFIHQHAVDAFAVQHLGEDTKIIKATYGLLGLCLYLEHGFSGKEVQHVHVKLSSDKSDWPNIQYPIQQIAYSIQTILNAPEGKHRDQEIRNWCELIWKAHQANQQPVRDWLKRRGII